MVLRLGETATDKPLAQAKRVAAAPRRTAAPQAGLPMAYTYLPRPRVGWIAVTPNDLVVKTAWAKTKDEILAQSAAYQKSIDQGITRVAQRYQGGRDALEDSYAIDELESYFIRLIHNNNKYGRQPNTGRVFYLGPDKAYVTLELNFRSADDPLGPPNQPEIWRETLVKDASWAFTEGVPTVYRGHYGSMVVNNEDAKAFHRHDKMNQKRTHVKMVLALNHRTELHVKGYLKPEDLARLVDSLDPDALLNRAAAMN
jgi:hypothetical protein